LPESTPPEVDQRQIGDWIVRIDRTLCVGFGECIEAAPEAFALDGEDLVVFVDPGQSAREQLLGACEVCPVDAITIHDENGSQVCP